MMREAKIDTIVQVLTVPVQMYAGVSGCTQLYAAVPVQLYVSRKITDESDGSRHQNCRRVDHVAKIYVIRGSSVENFISANLKIQSAEY